MTTTIPRGLIRDADFRVLQILRILPGGITTNASFPRVSLRNAVRRLREAGVPVCVLAEPDRPARYVLRSPVEIDYSLSHPARKLADIQVTTESQDRAPMGRVVDVAGLGGMDTGPGGFSARITDPLCPWNEGLWRFETVDGLL